MSKVKISIILYYSCDELNLYAYHLLYNAYELISYNFQVLNLLLEIFYLLPLLCNFS